MFHSRFQTRCFADVKIVCTNFGVSCCLALFFCGFCCCCCCCMRPTLTLPFCESTHNVVLCVCFVLLRQSATWQHALNYWKSWGWRQLHAAQQRQTNCCQSFCECLFCLLVAVRRLNVYVVCVCTECVLSTSLISLICRRFLLSIMAVTVLHAFVIVRRNIFCFVLLFRTANVPVFSLIGSLSLFVCVCARRRSSACMIRNK